MVDEISDSLLDDLATKQIPKYLHSLHLMPIQTHHPITVIASLSVIYSYSISSFLS